MNAWIIIWLIFWAAGMGIPNYLFKKYKITYYEKSWQHSLFFLVLTTLLFITYKSQFGEYFASVSWEQIVFFLLLTIAWLVAPAFYQKDYYTKKERIGYQIPKYYEVLFQDICFLGGLLTFGISPGLFGFVFFLVHLPAVFLLPKRFALLPITGSLVGGLIIAYLQASGVSGFLFALFVHLSFWFFLHYFLVRNKLFGVLPVKR